MFEAGQARIGCFASRSQNVSRTCPELPIRNRFLLTAQIRNQHSIATRDDITWEICSPTMSAPSLATVLDPKADLLQAVTSSTW